MTSFTNHTPAKRDVKHCLTSCGGAYRGHWEEPGLSCSKSKLKAQQAKCRAMKLMHSCNHVSWQMQQPLATMANTQGWPIDHPYAPDHGCQADSQPHLVVLTPASSHACPQGKWKRRDPSFSFLWDCCEDSTKMLPVLIRRELNTFCTPFPPAEKRSAPRLQRTKVEHHHPAKWICAPWMRSWSTNQLASSYCCNHTSTCSVKLFVSPNKHHTWWQGSARTNCNPGHPIIQKTVALWCLFWIVHAFTSARPSSQAKSPNELNHVFLVPGHPIEMSSSQASSCLVVCENTLLARMYLYHPLSPVTWQKGNHPSSPDHKGDFLGH